MSQAVATIRTPASASDVLGALINAGLSQNAAVMAAAQSALETGGWQQMWNWNLGNVTTNGDYYLLGSDTTHHYRPSDSLSAGAADFVGYLTNRGLIPYADAGDLAGYVSKLKSFGYFESDASAYQSGMQSWIDRLGGVTPTYGFPWKTIGIVAAILIGASATAYYIVEGELPSPMGLLPKPTRRRRLARENPTDSMRVQSLLFDRSEYTVPQAKAWARGHGFKSSKVDLKPETIRLRQESPSKFETFRTKSFGHGVRAVVAR